MRYRLTAVKIVEVFQLGARNMTLIMWGCESAWEDETMQRPDYLSSLLQVYSIVFYVTPSVSSN